MSIHEGEQVQFQMGQNILIGTVDHKFTEPGVVGDKIAHASRDEPRYDINYEPTGTHFIRTENSINPVSGSHSSSHSSSQPSDNLSEVHSGDHVTFHIGRNQLEGTVTDILTEPTYVGDKIAHASKDDPRIAVHYDGTNTDFIRTPDTIQHS